VAANTTEVPELVFYLTLVGMNPKRTERRPIPAGTRHVWIMHKHRHEIPIHGYVIDRKKQSPEWVALVAYMDPQRRSGIYPALAAHATAQTGLLETRRPLRQKPVPRVQCGRSGLRHVPFVQFSAARIVLCRTVHPSCTYLPSSCRKDLRSSLS